MTVFMTTYRHDEVGELTIASDGEAIVGLWMEGQKYFGSGLPQPFERRDDLPVFEQARRVARPLLRRRAPPIRSSCPSRRAAPRSSSGCGGSSRGSRSAGLRTYADIAEQIAREDAEPSDGAFPDGYEPSRTNGTARRGRRPRGRHRQRAQPHQQYPCRATASSARTAASPATPAASSASSGCSATKASTSAG